MLTDKRSEPQVTVSRLFHLSEVWRMGKKLILKSQGGMLPWPQWKLCIYIKDDPRLVGYMPGQIVNPVLLLLTPLKTENLGTCYFLKQLSQRFAICCPSAGREREHRARCALVLWPIREIRHACTAKLNAWACMSRPPAFISRWSIDTSISYKWVSRLYLNALFEHTPSTECP